MHKFNKLNKLPKELLFKILSYTYEIQDKSMLEDIRNFHKSRQIIDEIYVEAANNHKWTWSQIAVHAGLSYMTVVKLGERQTKYPRHMTIYKLAKSVGWKLMVVNEVTKGKAVSKPKLVAVG